MDFTNFLNFLNNNSGALIVIFTAIVTLSTIVYAILTGLLVHETRRMREAQTEPKVDIKFAPREEWINLVEIEIKNIGLGPAYNVYFEITRKSQTPATDKLVSELMGKNFFRSGLNYLSPGQKIKTFLINMIEDFESKVSISLSILVSYKSLSGKKYSNVYVIDLSELKGLRQLGEPPLHKMSKKIEALQKDIHNLLTGFHRIKADVYTSDDRDKERVEEEAYYKDLKEKSREQK